MADARLQLILDLREKVLAPLRSIQSGSKDAAAALKSTRDQLRDLEKVQQDMDGLRKTRVQLRGQQRDLQELQTKLSSTNSGLTEHRERHKNITASLKTARESHGKLTKALQDGATATPEFSRQLELARIRLQSSQGAYERSNSTLRGYRTQIKNTETGIAQLSGKIDHGKERLQGYQQRLERAGISTDKLGQQSRNQKIQIEAATAAMERQKQTLAGLKAQQEKLAALKEKHGKAMMHTGMAAATGVAMVAGGRAVAKPVQATLGAFSQQENATTQLSASMMQSDGSVAAEFTQIDALAKRLGDRLPGTTADFIEMMTMLRRQGLSAQSILGGTGEAAALLGVQLRMPVTEAAEFAAKMQDATRTTEKDMLGLMDMIQRTFYLGVDSGNMLQGFTKMSPVMNVIRKDGLEASKMLAPLLVMMDQTGMKGESAGNAFRKIFQSAMNTDKIKKVTDGLKKEKGISLKLDFTNGKGEFGSIDQMYAELSKLNGLTTEKRLAVIKDLFGDDSETIQALDTMISKGKAGYDEVVVKMEAQADLQKRVDQQLGTLSNVMEAAQGGFTNVMADIGDTIKNDAKDVIKAIGDITSSVGGWIKEHPALTAGIARTVAVLAGLLIVLGTLLVPLALIAGKFMLMRFLFGMLSIKVPMLGAGFKLLGGGLKGLVGVITKLTGTLLSGLMLALRVAMGAIVKLGVALFTTPVGWFVLAIAAIAGAAYLIYKNWGAISSFFSGLWDSVKAKTAAAWENIKTRLSGLWSSTQAMATGIWAELSGFFAGLWHGIQTTASGAWQFITSTLSVLWSGAVSMAGSVWGGLPGFFTGLWQGIRDRASAAWSGITSMLEQVWSSLVAGASAIWQQMGGSFPAVLQTISAAIINWSPLGLFYQAFAGVMSYFGVELPTKFSEFGANIIQGLVNGITGSLALVRDAVGSAADSAIGWFKEKLGIHSPSRVFMAAGVNVGEGAAIGIESTVGMVRKSAGAMALAAGVSLAAPSIAQPALRQLPQLAQQAIPLLADPVQIDRRPALARQAPAAQRPAPVIQGDTITIQVHAAPGMDPQDLAREVERLLDQRDRAKAARLSNSFTDWN